MKKDKKDSDLKRLHKWAWFLDSSIPVPGTNFRIGVDAIIGLIPGIGDLMGTILSSYILLGAAREGTSKAILIRMVINILIESLMGLIPIVGDIFDMVWKANLRNMKLLEAYKKNPSQAKSSSLYFSLVAGLILILVVGIISFVSITVLRWFWITLTS